MTMTRDEQLELVARNIDDWPYKSSPSIVAFWLCDKVCYTSGFGDNKFTRSEVGAKRREITGEPDDKDAPEWAVCKAQDPDGWWCWYQEENPSTDSLGWKTKVACHMVASCGEVLGDWRDTLKPVKRDPKVTPEEDDAFDAMASKDDIDGGAEFVHGEKYRIKGSNKLIRFIGDATSDRDFGVFFDGLHYFEYQYLLVEPVPSELEEFVLNCESLYVEAQDDPRIPVNFSKTAAFVFYAISEGHLPVPEIKK